MSTNIDTNKNNILNKEDASILATSPPVEIPTPKKIVHK